MSNNIYDILGKIGSALGVTKPVEDTIANPVYENVEPRGSITEAVASLEEKYMGFKKTAAAVKKGGSAEDPEAVAAAIGRKKYGKEKFQKAAAAGKKLGEETVEEGQGPYELYNPKHPKFAANYKKYKAKNPDCKLEDFIAAMKKKEHGVDEAIDPELLKAAGVGLATGALIPVASNLGYKAGEKIDKWLEKRKAAKSKKAVKEGEYDPAPVDPEAVAKHKRLQAIKDRQEEKDDWFSGKEEKPSNVRVHHAKYQDEPETDDLDEVAPPGAKAERMVKHIKKGYAKDGKLTKREKGIAYATAWKAHNKGQVEEGVEFGDTIENSKAELKKAKPAMVKESRVMEETDYFYEKIGRALAEKNPTLDTASLEFNTAVYKEMVAQGIQPNRARNIMKIDDDFMSDVADSYHHCCQEVAECNAPVNSFVGGNELDEIARLAGLPVEETEVYNEVNVEESPDTMDEGVGSVVIRGKPVNVNSIEVDGVDSHDYPDFADAYISYAEFADGTPLTDDELDYLTAEHGELVNQAAHGKLQDAADFMSEEEMGEGNEFSGALAAAKASGAKEFEVDGKKYTVKEDVQVNVTANGEEDVVNLIRKLSGMPVIAVAAQEAEPVIDMTGVEAVEEERDIEHANTPDEEVFGIDAAIPSGTDLNRSKKQDPATANKAANPLAVKEESLWKAYEGMLDEVKK